MKWQVIVRVRATADLQKATNWYEEQDARISLDFVASVETVFDQLKSNPYIYQVYYKKFRQVITGGFPYRILYFVVGRKVFVARLFHVNQDFSKHIRFAPVCKSQQSGRPSPSCFLARFMHLLWFKCRAANHRVKINQIHHT